MAVVQLKLATPQSARQELLLQALRELGVDIGQNALGDAYNRIIKDHPDVTSDSDRFDMAVALTMRALAEAMRYVNNDVVGIADITKE